MPDDAQPDALRLLDASRAVVNQALAILWPHLAEFGSDRVSPAWKQVCKYIASPSPHGDRQWRCESEVLGRVLRAQAQRKKAFELVLPILCDSFIRPKTEKRPAGKKRSAFKEALTILQKSLEEDDKKFMLTSRATMGQKKAGYVFPGQSIAYNLSSLAIRQALQKLEHRHQCQAPRG